MIDLSNLDWGWMDEPSDMVHIHIGGLEQDMGQYHKQSIIEEIYERKCYEQFFEVESGDIVLDIGASVGPFTYSILHKNPKQVFCLEPSEREFNTLCKNVRGYPVIPIPKGIIPKGISNVNSIVDSNMLFGGETEMETITFSKFINLYNIKKLILLKPIVKVVNMISLPKTTWIF
jgi:hypothetical protein